MYKLIEINIGGDNVKIINTNIMGLVSNKEKLLITLILKDGGQITSTANNLEEFINTEMKWANVINETIDRWEEARNESLVRQQEESASRKTHLLLQAKMTGAATDFMSKHD